VPAAGGIAAAEKLDGVVRFDLFPNASVTLRRTGISVGPSGGYVWEGSHESGAFNEALLVIQNGRISGRVQLDDRLFRIDHVSGGVHSITEVDATKFPNEIGVEPHPRQIRAVPQGHASPSESEDAAAKVIRKIRVLVAYTVNAKNQAGGAAAILNRIDQAIALANQAYVRANADVRLVLAGPPQQVSYNEKADIIQDLNNLTNAASFQTLRNRRNLSTVNADLLSLFIKINATACGIAWFPGAGTMPTPGPGTAETGYSVMVHNCVTNLSFHHEVAHNMGLRHDRFVDGSAGGYNFGFVNLAKKKRTIMAYNDRCEASGFNCTRINYFSSRTIRGQPGSFVIGNASNDNTRRLKDNYTAVSQYNN